MFTAALIILRVRSGTSTCPCFGRAIAGVGGSSFGVSLFRNAGFMAMVILPAYLDRSSSHRSRRIRSVVQSLCLSVFCLHAAGIAAQTEWHASPWHASFEQPLQTSITEQMIEEFVAVCSLSDNQAALARLMFEEHLERMARFRAQHLPLLEQTDIAQALKPLLSGAKLTFVEKEEILTTLANREGELAKVADQQSDLDDQILRELRALLHEEQATHWPTFAERVNRSRWLHARAGFPGDHVDLLHLLRDLKLTPDDLLVPMSDFEQMMRAYSRQLNQTIIKRRDFEIRRARHTMRQQLRQHRANQQTVGLDDAGRPTFQSTDPEYHIELRADIAARAEHLRHLHSLNEDFRTRVANLLNGRVREVFQNRYLDSVLHLPVPRAMNYIAMLLDSGEIEEARATILAEWKEELDRRMRAIAIREYELSCELAERRFADDSSDVNASRALMQQMDEIATERALWDNQIMRRVWQLLSAEEQSRFDRPRLWNQ